MIHSIFAEYENVRVRPLAHDDIESLRILRNDAERTKYLRKVGEITPELQQRWYENYLTDNDIMTWSIDEIGALNRFVGSVSLYNFRGDKCEVGKIIIDPRAGGRGIGPKAESMCMYLMYQYYQIKTIDGVVNIENQFSIKHTLKAGLKMVFDKDKNEPIIIKDVQGVSNYYFEANIDEFMAEHKHYQLMKVGQWNNEDK